MKKRNSIHQEYNLGSNSKIICAKLNSKGTKLFISGDDKNNINLWKFDNNTPILSLSNQSSNSSVQIETTSVIFDYPENLIFSGSNRGMINVWDIQAQKRHMVAISCLSHFPLDEKNNLLVSGSLDNNIKLWDIRQKQCITTWKGHSSPLNCIDCSPDGNWVVSGSHDRMIKIWDVLTWKQIYNFNLHNATITQTKFNQKELCLASASSDKTIKYWNLEKFNLICETKLEATPIQKICYSLDGKLLYSAANESLKVWDLEKNAILLDNIESSWKNVLDMGLDNSSESLYGISSGNNSIKLWCTNLKSINMTDQKRKSVSLARIPSQKEIKKELTNNENRKLGIGNQERRINFVSEAQRILEQKQIDINLNDVLDQYLEKKTGNDKNYVTTPKIKPNDSSIERNMRKLTQNTFGLNPPKTPKGLSTAGDCFNNYQKLEKNKNNENRISPLKKNNDFKISPLKRNNDHRISPFKKTNDYRISPLRKSSLNNFLTEKENIKENNIKENIKENIKDNNKENIKNSPIKQNLIPELNNFVKEETIEYFEMKINPSLKVIEAENSIINMNKFENEDLQLSSFLIDKDAHSDKYFQFDLIKEISREHNKFLGILQARINYINPINHWLQQKNFTSAIFIIQKLKHYSLLFDAFNILNQQNFIENIKVTNAFLLIEKSKILLESKYEDILADLSILNDENNNDESHKKKISKNFDILHSLIKSSRIKKIISTEKQVSKKANHLKSEIEILLNSINKNLLDQTMPETPTIF